MNLRTTIIPITLLWLVTVGCNSDEVIGESGASASASSTGGADGESASGGAASVSASAGSASASASGSGSGSESGSSGSSGASATDSGASATDSGASATDSASASATDSSSASATDSSSMSATDGATGATDSSSTGDACDVAVDENNCTLCLEEQCCAAYAECLLDPQCLCLSNCLFEAGLGLVQCELQCGVVDPVDALGLLLQCDSAITCADECPSLATIHP